MMYWRKTVKKDLLKGVYEDASWLMHAVENILSITRMDEGNLELIKSMEAVEEVVAESVSRIKKLAVNHIIKIKIPDELILSADGWNANWTSLGKPYGQCNQVYS